MARQKSWKKLIFAVQLKQIRRKNVTPNIKTQQSAYQSKYMIHVKCMPVFKSRSLFYCVFLIPNFSKIIFFFCLSQAATSLRNLSILQKLFSPLWVCVFMLHFSTSGPICGWIKEEEIT